MAFHIPEVLLEPNISRIYGKGFAKADSVPPDYPVMSRLSTQSTFLCPLRLGPEIGGILIATVLHNKVLHCDIPETDFFGGEEPTARGDFSKLLLRVKVAEVDVYAVVR